MEFGITDDHYYTGKLRVRNNMVIRFQGHPGWQKILILEFFKKEFLIKAPELMQQFSADFLNFKHPSICWFAKTDMTYLNPF